MLMLMTMAWYVPLECQTAQPESCNSSRIIWSLNSPRLVVWLQAQLSSTLMLWFFITRVCVFRCDLWSSSELLSQHVYDKNPHRQNQHSPKHHDWCHPTRGITTREIFFSQHWHFYPFIDVFSIALLPPVLASSSVTPRTNRIGPSGSPCGSIQPQTWLHLSAGTRHVTWLTRPDIEALLPKDALVQKHSFYAIWLF